MIDTSDRRERTRAVWRLIALLLFVAVAATVGFLVPLPQVDDFRRDVADLGPAAAVLFLLGYAALTLAPVPKNVLSAAAGLIWGFGLGTLLVYLGALLGAALAFVIGRALGREAIERLTGARVARVDAVLRDRGLVAVIGVRLVPIIPFTLINYSAGLTAVRTRDYVLGTAIGILPGTLAYVALGAYGLELGWPFWLAVGLLGVLTIGGVVVASRLRRSPARRAEIGDNEMGADRIGPRDA